MTEIDGSPNIARIPADVDQPDRILLGLTARQIVIVAVTGLLLWGGYLSTRKVLPPSIFAVIAAVLGLCAVTLAIGVRDGLSLDRFVLAGINHMQQPKRLVLAPEGIPDIPQWIDAPKVSVAPLRLGIKFIDDHGIIDVGKDGLVAVCTTTTVNFELLSTTEQQSYIAGFSRWLNSIDCAVQILVRTQPVDLAPFITALRDHAGSLPDLALENAAVEHADFLANLNTQHDFLCRTAILVFREPTAQRTKTAAIQQLLRHVDNATRLLAAADITVTLLDNRQASSVLASCTSSKQPIAHAGSAPVIRAFQGESI